MKSLLSSYFNRHTHMEQEQSKTQIETSSFSSLASSSAITSGCHSSSSSSSVEQQNQLNDSSIKYIDDIDTDGMCYSSADDDYDSNNLNLIKNNDIKLRMNSNDTVIKTLEKINESLQLLFEDCNEKNSNNNNNKRTTTTTTKTNSLVDLKDCLFLIKQLTLESQDYLKKLADNEMKQHDLKNSNETDLLNKTIKDLTEKLIALETVNKQQNDELERTKEICESIRSDRKRLKSEKLELLNQAKDLYSTIETKENELRDFLRHYETKTKETSFAVKKLIDTKAIIEQEKIDLQTQVFELLEEKNELKLLIESKNANITKLQKQLFELNTRNSLSKDSDYGYVSIKASRDTLSTSLIENHLKLNEFNSNNNVFDTQQKIKLNSRTKEERLIKCKSNDCNQILKNNQLKNYQQQQQLESKKQEDTSNIPSQNSNQSIIDYENDLNKVLDSEEFIDLDSSSSEKGNYKKTKSYSNDSISKNNNLIHIKQQGMSLNKIDETTNRNDEQDSSCTSSIVSFSKSTSSSSSSDSVTNSVEATSTTTGSTSSSSSSSSGSTTSDGSVSTETSESLSNNSETNNQVVRRYQPKQPKKYLSTSVFNDNSATVQSGSMSQFKSSRILNSLIKMSTTNAIVGSTGSSINLDKSISTKVPLFTTATATTTTLSSSKIKNKNQAFNSTMSMNNTINSTLTSLNQTNAKSLYSICDSTTTTSNPNNTSRQSMFIQESKAVAQDVNTPQVTCLKMNCLKTDPLLDHMQNINEWPIEKVKHWLEQIGMQQSQIKNGLKYIKNGKALTSLSDNELERIFLIGNTLHKRKLRLALDDLKSPEKCKYPKMNEITNDWICNVWLREIGLVQFKSIFRLNLIDGRVLNSLQKKDLEKYMSIHKRNNQISLLIAIDFLRKFEFDIEKISFMRDNFVTNNHPTDTSLWKNEDIPDWLKLVNLQAFTKNLPESGLHGPLIHDNIFTVDFLYTSLQVTDEPRYQNMKKILEDEIKLLRKPRINVKTEFARSASVSKSEKKLFTIRGSLGRALGKKMKRDISSPLIDDDTYRRIEFSHKIIDMKNNKNFSTSSAV